MDLHTHHGRDYISQFSDLKVKAGHNNMLSRIHFTGGDALKNNYSITGARTGSLLLWDEEAWPRCSRSRKLKQLQAEKAAPESGSVQFLPRSSPCAGQ